MMTLSDIQVFYVYINVGGDFRKIDLLRSVLVWLIVQHHYKLYNEFRENGGMSHYIAPDSVSILHGLLNSNFVLSVCWQEIVLSMQHVGNDAYLYICSDNSYQKTDSRIDIVNQSYIPAFWLTWYEAYQMTDIISPIWY